MVMVGVRHRARMRGEKKRGKAEVPSADGPGLSSPLRAGVWHSRQPLGIGVYDKEVPPKVEPTTYSRKLLALTQH